MSNLIAFPTNYAIATAHHTLLKRTKRPSVLPDNVIPIEAATVKAKVSINETVAIDLAANIKANFEHSIKLSAERLKNTKELAAAIKK